MRRPRKVPSKLPRIRPRHERLTRDLRAKRPATHVDRKKEEGRRKARRPIENEYPDQSVERRFVEGYGQEE